MNKFPKFIGFYNSQRIINGEISPKEIEEEEEKDNLNNFKYDLYELGESLQNNILFINKMQDDIKKLKKRLDLK